MISIDSPPFLIVFHNMPDNRGVCVSEGSALREMWEKYRKQFVYAQDIIYEQVMDSAKNFGRLVFQGARHKIAAPCSSFSPEKT